MKSRLSIDELNKRIELQINKKMEQFSKLGVKSKAASQLVIDYQKQMYDILKELESHEDLLRTQRPELCELFDALKDEFGHKDTQE
jgi:hypothetical protein